MTASDYVVKILNSVSDERGMDKSAWADELGKKLTHEVTTSYDA